MAATVPLSFCDGGHSGSATRCGCCRVPFHHSCAERYALSAVEQGKVPLKCPVPGCSSAWSAGLLAWVLDEVQLARYNTVVNAVEAHRAVEAEGNNPTSPRSVAILERLGFRPCPRCGVFIQKQPDGLLSGCDKMTCRCGCMFCFKCGVEARIGGVARCRCVGTHHVFIPQAQVLSNYRGIGPIGAAGDLDLTKRDRGKASKQTVARLRKELRAIHSDPPPYVHVHCDEATSILFWDLLIEGPPETVYDAGWYWGRLEIPKDYPFSPPLIRIITPNGRFEADAWLCRLVADYHPEGWQPTWTLASFLIALLALMCAESFTAGAIHPPIPEGEKRCFAQLSLAWNKEQSEFRRAFPDCDCIVAQAADRRASEGLGPGLSVREAGDRRY